MKYVGSSVPGLTNRTLVSGSGTYTADIQLPGMWAVAILRSPYAHARIVAIDTQRAQAEPGVVAILTGREIEQNTNHIPSAADPGFYGGKSLKVYALPDYTLPTAVEVPILLLDHQSTPSPFTLLGSKGVGESGVAGPLGAVASAIEDALPHLKLSLMETPLTPARLWHAMREASHS